jgi:hypothetical protein
MYGMFIYGQYSDCKPIEIIKEVIVEKAVPVGGGIVMTPPKKEPIFTVKLIDDGNENSFNIVAKIVSK